MLLKFILEVSGQPFKVPVTPFASLWTIGKKANHCNTTSARAEVDLPVLLAAYRPKTIFDAPTPINYSTEVCFLFLLVSHDKETLNQTQRDKFVQRAEASREIG